MMRTFWMLLPACALLLGSMALPGCETGGAATQPAVADAAVESNGVFYRFEGGRSGGRVVAYGPKGAEACAECAEATRQYALTGEPPAPCTSCNTQRRALAPLRYR